jgi:hypothetical protein
MAAGQALAETQSEYTRIKKSELLDEIKKNRGKHTKEFEAAHAGWLRQSLAKMHKHVESCRKIIKNVEAGREKPGFEHLYLDREPKNHSGDYDRIIRRLEMSMDDEQHLDHDDFDKFVMDQWDWKAEHTQSVTSYTVS